MDSKLDSLFEAATKDGKFPGLAAIIVDSQGKFLYRKAFGLNNISAPDSGSYTTSTPTLIWSCTKMITCIAALQLVEQGKLSLSDLVEQYVPEINNIQVLDPSSKDANGNYSLRAAKTKPTILQLMTHSAGFTYDFFDNDTLTWEVQNQKTPATYLAIGSWDCLQTPLAFDAGERHNYGISIDWLGFVVEAISKQGLHEYITNNILKPLGMNDTVAHFPEGKARMAVHMKDTEDKIVGNMELIPAANPERYGGGHYLISTLDDYGILLTTILNHGTHPVSNTKILSADTVDKYLFEDFLPEATSKSSLSAEDRVSTVGKITVASIPQLSNTGALLPHEKTGWSCGLMVNLEDVPNGRNKGSGAWAGMGNLYYWIDPKGDRAGMIMTSILPFLDETVLRLFGEVENAAYGGKGEVKNYAVT